MRIHWFRYVRTRIEGRMVHDSWMGPRPIVEHVEYCQCGLPRKDDSHYYYGLSRPVTNLPPL